MAISLPLNLFEGGASGVELTAKPVEDAILGGGIGLGEILDASDRYFEASGRRLTFEYVLLAEINDQPEHARKLAGRLRGRSALLNVIPYNPVSGLPYRTPSHKALERFLAILQDAGINVQVRERKGDKIDAACGQLRRAQAEPTVMAISPQVGR